MRVNKIYKIPLVGLFLSLVCSFLIADEQTNGGGGREKRGRYKGC